MAVMQGDRSVGRISRRLLTQASRYLLENFCYKSKDSVLWHDFAYLGLQLL